MYEIKGLLIKYCLLWLSSPIYSIFLFNFHKLYSITQLYSTETLVSVTHFIIIHKFKAMGANEMGYNVTTVSTTKRLRSPHATPRYKQIIILKLIKIITA